MQTDDTFDPFAPAGEAGYSREKFYTRATDSRGHSKSFRYGTAGERASVLSIPPELHGMMMELRSRYAPYKSNADIMRDALIHLYHTRREQMGSPDMRFLQILDRAVAMAEVERLEAEGLAEEANLERLGRLVDDARRSKSPARLKRARDAVFAFYATSDDEDSRRLYQELLDRL